MYTVSQADILKTGTKDDQDMYRNLWSHNLQKFLLCLVKRDELSIPLLADEPGWHIAPFYLFALYTKTT